jgi:hypothetical protein
MFGLFRSLEEYVGPSTLPVGVVHLGFLGLCAEMFFGIRLPLVERDVSTVI